MANLVPPAHVCYNACMEIKTGTNRPKRSWKTWPALLAAGLAVGLVYIFVTGCPILYFTGVPCPGCGMSRAALALCRGHLREALGYHPLIFLAPFLVWAIVGKWGVMAKPAVRKWTIIVLSAIFIGVYLWRLLVQKSPVVAFHFPPEIWVDIQGIFS